MELTTARPCIPRAGDLVISARLGAAEIAWKIPQGWNGSYDALELARINTEAEVTIGPFKERIIETRHCSGERKVEVNPL